MTFQTTNDHTVTDPGHIAADIPYRLTSKTRTCAVAFSIIPCPDSPTFFASRFHFKFSPSCRCRYSATRHIVFILESTTALSADRCYFCQQLMHSSSLHNSLRFNAQLPQLRVIHLNFSQSSLFRRKTFQFETAIRTTKFYRITDARQGRTDSRQY